MTHRVAVVGTLNMDLVVRVQRRPDIGETVIGQSLTERPGGKGANQALAAAGRAPASLIGVVGDDDTGRRMLDAQRAGGVDVRHVAVTGEVSGRAIIEVDDSGDNRIVVVSGANSLLTPQMVIGALDDVDPAVVMTQLESPERVTAAVAEWCGRRDRRLVLNPSPVAPLRSEVIAASNPLVVNEIEAAYYADASSGDVDADAEAVARELCAMAKSVVITLGADGVVAADCARVSRVTVDRTPVADTTGAGDHFAGILAAALAGGADLHDAAADAARAATAYLAARQGS